MIVRDDLYLHSDVINCSSGFFVIAILFAIPGGSKAFSSIVAVFSETSTCLATYLVGKLVDAFSTRKLTGSPKRNKKWTIPKA